jgi:hypothetical protein
MKSLRGLKLLAEQEGAGMSAKKGDRIVYNARIFLSQGDEVPLNDVQSKQSVIGLVRVEGGVTFVDHILMLGSRQAIAGIEHALVGMKVGGYRKVLVSPHLAYRDKGIPDRIPPGAVLKCEIWLRNIENLSSGEPLPGVV